MGFCGEADRMARTEGERAGQPAKPRIRFSFSEGGPPADELLERVVELAEDALRRNSARRPRAGAADGGTGHD